MPRFSRNETDRHIGLRIKQRRRDLGVSQASLAAALDLSAQQVQKYEYGTNQIAASLLAEVARQLAVPIGYFFDDNDPSGHCSAIGDCQTQSPL